MANTVVVKETLLIDAAQEGMDAFLNVFIEAIHQYLGGDLNADNMGKLNTDQLTLLSYNIVRDEVMDGGFVQLIHNGYGPFIFTNPFAKVLKIWGLAELGQLINKVHRLYNKYGAEIEKDCTDDEFMALFEQYQAFDDCDDNFMENEERWTEDVARYIDNHMYIYNRLCRHIHRLQLFHCRQKQTLRDLCRRDPP